MLFLGGPWVDLATLFVFNENKNSSVLVMEQQLLNMVDRLVC